MKVFPRLAGKACAAVLLAAGFCSAAQADMEPLTDILYQPGSAGLGLMTRIERSPYSGSGLRADLVPLYLYEGERLFLHGARGGIKLSDAGAQRVDLFLEQRFEGFSANRIPSGLAGIEARNSGIDLGLAWRTRQPWGTVQAELLRDVSSTSKGTELRLDYSRDWRSGAWTWRPSATLAWRDAAINNYYYGISASEAVAGRPAYAPGSGMNATLGLYASYDLTQGWRLLGGVSATMLDRKIGDSPIVEKRVIPAVYIGAAYDFGGHKREWAKDSSPTWFKLLYGQSTDDGCHLAKIITAQCLSTASVDRTDIAGIQVGKPFISGLNGWPLDIVGYVGLTQHDDKGLQPSGAQLDLFMKAYYSGFPWSARVKTRLGLGVGVSLAQRVPYIEASSQAARGRPSSRLLNYLDPSIDFSLGDALGMRSLKDTYLGLGVSHRSGIFGSSRLLGNVNGGSNYIYTYIETAL
jgi:outer membrane protein